MFHCYYTCDVCQRVLDTKEEVRYVIRISPSFDGDGVGTQINEDRDYLEEINDQLELTGGCSDVQPLGDDEPVEYDLCSECRQKFSLESAGSRVIQSVGFSEN